MPSNCIIENWFIKNKTWLLFLAMILGTWIAGVFGLMIFKWFYFNISWHDARISLSNILSLGAAIGAMCIGIGALWFAQIQTKINDNTYQYQISQRYVDSYNNLINIFENAYQLFHEEKEIDMMQENQLKKYASTKFTEMLHSSSKVKNEAYLMFPNNPDIIKFTKNMYEEIYDIKLHRDRSITFDLILEDINNIVPNRPEKTQSLILIRNNAHEKTIELQSRFLSKYMNKDDKYLYLSMVAQYYQKHLSV